MKIVFYVLGIAMLISQGGAVAQSVVFDSATEKYQVTYHSSYLGPAVVALVDPPNKIEPSVRLVRVEEHDGAFSYHYDAVNGRGMRSKQSVVEFDFDCPERSVVTVTPPKNWERGVGRLDEGFICILIEDTENREGGIVPGGTLSGLEVRTQMLPAAGTARFWGNAEEVRWPTGESMETLDIEVIRTVEGLEGIRGGWVERAAIVPIRDPREGPLSILEALNQDLAGICQAGYWIREPLCASYRAELGEIVTAVRDERFVTARERIQSLLDEIETSREAPQRQLQPDAYWLLRMNLEVVGAGLDDVLSAENLEGPSDTTSSEARGFWNSSVSSSMRPPGMTSTFTRHGEVRS